MTANINTNIPTMNLKDFRTTALAMYESFTQTKTRYPAIMLWGAPGVGKSDIIKQIANDLADRLNKKPHVVDVRLLLFNPVDLRGIPSADEKKENCRWLRPQIFQMDESEEVMNFLVLDEITAAPQSVQAAAYQIVLDRQIGEHKLPDNCIIIAAGNRITDKSVSYTMPKALCNRMMHINIEPNVDAWLDWAMNKGIDGRITGYVAWKGTNALFSFDPASQEQAFPTPRSWEATDKLLKTGLKFNQIRPMIEATVGVGTTTEFTAFCKTYSELPDIDKIFTGEYKEYPTNTRPDIWYALTMAIYDKLYTSERLTKNTLSNAFTYINGMGTEYKTLILSKVIDNNNLFNKCSGVKEFENLVIELGQYVFTD